MTNKFSTNSRGKLDETHDHIQCVFEHVLPVYDITVVWGYRGERTQTKAFEEGYSDLEWPKSRHNLVPSLAIDVVPYPIDWNDIERFIELSWVIKGVISVLECPLEWGGDWTTRKDYAHWQLPRGYTV
jgi:hypothetical protein